jgi:ABC-type branched-subunit amino acid transport system substrate-binding protein
MRSRTNADLRHTTGVGVRRSRRASFAAVVIGLGVSALTLVASRSLAAKTPALDLRGADTAVQSPAGKERDRALTDWAKHASLPDLMYVLRHEALGEMEATLVRAAYDKTPPEREALRRRLLLRLAQVAPKDAARLAAELPVRVNAPTRPGGSVFRLAALLPDTGGYESYGRAIRLGLEIGLAQAASATPRPVVLAFHPSGDDEPARALAVFDSVADQAACVVGELLSGPTLVLAAGSRFVGTPLISPTATDEDVGRLGASVFQLGPSGAQRGARLARAVIDRRGLSVGLLASNRPESAAFANGFAVAAESLGAVIVWRDSYVAGNLSFKGESRTLAMRKLDVLFWDGEAREAEALVRQLANDRTSVRLCGGSDLDPAVQHGSMRSLLEGARYVEQDWRLAPATQARLDSLVKATGEPNANRLHASGYLAARLVASAVEGGALCPEELSAALRKRVSRDPYLARRGFIDWQPAEATLTVCAIRNGRAVELP